MGWVQASGTEEVLTAHTRMLPEDEEDFTERCPEKMGGAFQRPRGRIPVEKGGAQKKV